MTIVHFKNNYLGRIRLPLILCMLCGSIQAQKPCIDTGTINNWPGLGNFQVSNNGQYFFYEISEKSEYKVVLEPTSFKWKMTLEEDRSCVFMQNSEKALVLRKDSLAIVDLDADHAIHYMTNISDFDLVKYGDNNDLLLYRLRTKPDELVVRDMKNGKEKRFPDVERYWSSANANVLALEIKSKQDTSDVRKLSWVQMSNDSVRQMWRGREVKKLLFDEKGQQCTFTAVGLADSSVGIWCYRGNDRMAEKIIDDHCDGVEKEYHIYDLMVYNGVDNRVFFYLEKDTTPPIRDTLVGVDIWNYKDASLQSAQFNGWQGKLFYKAALNITDRKVIRLARDGENMTSPLYAEKPMRFVLISKGGDGDGGESGWNKDGLKSVYLLSLKDGTRSLINNNLPFSLADYYVLSYDENYVYYYDSKSRNYYSYCIRDSTRRNLTASLRTRWTISADSDRPDSSYSPYGVARLIKNEDAVLVYDQHCIYTLDPNAKTPAVKLSGLQQEADDLEIRLVPRYMKDCIDRHQQYCFSVFNHTDKREAIFQSRIDSLKYCTAFRLQPYYFEDLETIRARDSSLYFVTRMTAETSPNVYMTDDFGNYQPITDLYPEKAYNWMKSELVTWKTLDGSIDQGILYKPENFDPLKKYPLLVYYYEQLSDRLHIFQRPELSTGRLNIPMYVSQGYLVFVPDIHYSIGWPGRSASNAVVSGVNYLCHRKYIDRTKMGLQGHSFGGFETNYIVTHTHLFAAAMSASAVSDFVSGYGGLGGNGNGRQDKYEWGQSRIGATLWQKPELYLENSPVLRADKVTTPLLMMADKDDDVVPFEQGIEFFTALRRLGKKAWMLQYDGNSHTVFGKASLDLTIRMLQFFNYYLKGEPPPAWMTKGIPAKLKGVESGLEADSSGAQP